MATLFDGLGAIEKIQTNTASNSLAGLPYERGTCLLYGS